MYSCVSEGIFESQGITLPLLCLHSPLVLQDRHCDLRLPFVYLALTSWLVKIRWQSWGSFAQFRNLQEHSVITCQLFFKAWKQPNDIGCPSRPCYVFQRVSPYTIPQILTDVCRFGSLFMLWFVGCWVGTVLWVCEDLLGILGVCLPHRPLSEASKDNGVHVEDIHHGNLRWVKLMWSYLFAQP